MSTSLPSNQNFVVDHQFETLAANGKVIRTSTFAAASVEGCGYDLRAGRALHSHHRDRRFDLHEQNEYCLEPLEVVTLETIEELDFRDPHCIGVIVSKHRLLAQGIVHPATSIDPGHVGPATVTLVNLGKHGWPIRFGDPIAKLLITPIAPVPKKLNEHPRGTIAYTTSRLPTTISTPESLREFVGGPLGEVVKRVDRLEDQIGRHRDDAELSDYRRRKANRNGVFVGIVAGVVAALIFELIRSLFHVFSVL